MFKNSVNKINQRFKNTEQRIVELDEKFYEIKNWIEDESDINSFLDITALYGKYSHLLGLENAKKRLLKLPEISVDYINNTLEQEIDFQRTTPVEINESILLYLKKRIELKEKKNKKTKLKNNSFFKKFSQTFEIKKV